MLSCLLLSPQRVQLLLLLRPSLCFVSLHCAGVTGTVSRGAGLPGRRHIRAVQSGRGMPLETATSRLLLGALYEIASGQSVGQILEGEGLFRKSVPTSGRTRLIYAGSFVFLLRKQKIFSSLSSPFKPFPECPVPKE